METYFKLNIIYFIINKLFKRYSKDHSAYNSNLNCLLFANVNDWNIPYKLLLLLYLCWWGNVYLIRKSRSFLLRVQINSVHFPKDDSSCCEWFIVTADFGGFREVKHLLIIFSLYRFEFHTKLFYCVWNVEFCVNQTAFAGGFDFFALIGRKSWSPSNACRSLWWHCSNW